MGCDQITARIRRLFAQFWVLRAFLVSVSRGPLSDLSSVWNPGKEMCSPGRLSELSTQLGGGSHLMHPPSITITVAILVKVLHPPLAAPSTKYLSTCIGMTPGLLKLRICAPGA